MLIWQYNQLTEQAILHALLKMHVVLTSSKEKCQFNELSWKNFFQPSLEENFVQSA